MKGSVWPRPFVKDPQTGDRRPVKGSTWTYQFAVPKADGGRRFVTKGGYATKKAAESALSEALVEHGRSPGLVVEPSKELLATYLPAWLEGRTNLKAATRGGYRRTIDNWLVPFIGDVRLCDLTPEQITKLYRALRVRGGKTRSGRKEDRTQSMPLNERSVHKAHVVLTAAMSYAARTGRLRVNPMTLVAKEDRPKQSGRPEMRVWTAEEASTFLEAAGGDRHAAIYDLALNSGLRRGELAGLRWPDIDLDAGTVAVRRNRVPVDGEVHEGTPKSSRPRVVDVDPSTVAMLRRWRREQLEERMAWGEAWTDSGYVFTREDGEPIHPETMGWHLERLTKVAGVPKIRFHDLRHTHATLGLAAGVPVKVMSERLGHASVQITLDLYQHVLPGMGADAAAKIAGLLRRA